MPTKPLSATTKPISKRFITTVLTSASCGQFTTILFWLTHIIPDVIDYNRLLCDLNLWQFSYVPFFYFMPTFFTSDFFLVNKGMVVSIRPIWIIPKIRLNFARKRLWLTIVFVLIFTVNVQSLFIPFPIFFIFYFLHFYPFPNACVRSVFATNLFCTTFTVWRSGF